MVIKRKTLSDLFRDVFAYYKMHVAYGDEYLSRVTVTDKGRILPLEPIQGVSPGLILLEHDGNEKKAELFLAAEAPKPGINKEYLRLVLSVSTNYNGEDGIFILPSIGDTGHTAGAFLTPASVQINKVNLTLQKKITTMLESGEYGERIYQYKRTFSPEIEEKLKISLRKLGLSTSTLNALNSIWIKSTRELVEYSKADLQKFKRIGKVTIAEIEEALKPLGVGLATV